jgi:hypothetical protein
MVDGRKERFLNFFSNPNGLFTINSLGSRVDAARRAAPAHGGATPRP